MKRALAAIRSLLICTVLWVLACTASPGQHNELNQIATTSWHGLTGLFVTPTAHMIGRGNLAIGFSESKHSEHVNGSDFADRQVRGVMTYGVADWLEVYYDYHNNMYVTDTGPTLNNHTFSVFGLKVRLMREHPCFWYPDISLAVRDLFNDTRSVGSLRNVNNGRKFYLLATKRVSNPAYNRFIDFNAGVTADGCTWAGLLGIELTIAPNVSLIVEAMWDSPYLNFRDFGEPDQCGRFTFNPGVRIYPYQVPNLALDMGFVGDGEFEFSFGASYVARL